MNDPRWLEWLRVAQSAVESPEAERMLRLDQACLARDELRASLEREPPRPPSADLARQLREVETSLSELTQRSRDQLAAALEELRRVRAGARGYRPEPTAGPALISRNV